MQITQSLSSFNALPDLSASRIVQAAKQTKQLDLSVGANSAQALQGQAQQTASAIVHQRADDVPDVTYPRLSITASNEQAPDMERVMAIQKEMNNTYAGMRTEWNSFRQSLTRIAPDLAGKDFGFTVDNHGDLMATETGDTLDAGQAKRLSLLMNKSSGLKSLANQFAQLSIDSTNSWGISKADIYHARHLDMENFNNTLDLGLMINKEKSREPGAGHYEYGHST